MLHQGNQGGSAQDESFPYTYRFGPFLFRSQIGIPELRGVGGSGQILVSVHQGEVPDEIEHATAYGKLCSVSPSQYLLNIPGVAGFHVADGNSIVVRVAPEATAADVSTFLLGSVFGALCHQNSLLPLHASAVKVYGEVTAFLGESGAGKSTLAACLERRGYRIIADDVCLLEQESDSGKMHIIPVAGWLKLWRTSLDHLSETPDERNRVYSADDKYRLYVESDVAERPRLANLVFLEKGHAGAAPQLVPLPTVEAIGLMMRLTYLGYITELTGSHARVFRQCARVLDDAKAYRLIVPWGFERMETLLDLLERTVLVRPQAPAA